MKCIAEIYKEKNDKLRNTIQNLLDALDAPFADSCDCGGSEICAICNAYRVLKEEFRNEKF